MTTDLRFDSSELEDLLEPIERRFYVDFYEALTPPIARGCGISWQQGDGFLRLSCATANHPFFNRVMGVGAAGQALGPWLDELVAHYREQGKSRWMLQVAPSQLASELECALTERGMVALRGWAKHAARVDDVPSDRPERGSDMRIERIGPDRARDWASILAPGFDFPPGSIDWPAATVGRRGWEHYLAYDGDQPAACAARFTTDGISTLGFAATRVSFRRRGAQSALIAAMIRDARREEIDWLVTETDEELPEKPNPSYRNVVRLGLPVRYVRANWGPPPS